jgi:hypothetical protein
MASRSVNYLLLSMRAFAEQAVHPATQPQVTGSKGLSPLTLLNTVAAFCF